MIWTTILNYERNPTTASGLAISITMMNSNITASIIRLQAGKNNFEYYLEVTSVSVLKQGILFGGYIMLQYDVLNSILPI